jgi:HEAT repeat protein
MALAEIGPAARPAGRALAAMLASDHENLRGRSWCASALPLVEADAEVAVPALLAALEDPSDEVRAVAVLSLEAYLQRSPEVAGSVLPDLVRRLHDEHWKVRGNAACALGYAGEDASWVLSDLVVALSDSAPYVRGCAAQGLGGHGRRARSALPQLRSATLDEDDDVRRRARQALNQISSPPAAAP